MSYPPIAEHEAAQMQLKWGEWKPIPRVSIHLPFGYAVSEDDPDTLVPVPLELEALEKAKTYREQGHSLRDLAEWLEQITGRKLSHSGLDKRIKSDRKRRARAQALRIWASNYKKAIEKAYEWDQKHSIYPDESFQRLLDPEYDPLGATRDLYDR
jgi:hypothetical protein